MYIHKTIWSGWFEKWPYAHFDDINMQGWLRIKLFTNSYVQIHTQYILPNKCLIYHIVIHLKGEFYNIFFHKTPNIVLFAVTTNTRVTLIMFDVIEITVACHFGISLLISMKTWFHMTAFTQTHSTPRILLSICKANDDIFRSILLQLLFKAIASLSPIRKNMWHASDASILSQSHFLRYLLIVYGHFVFRNGYICLWALFI